MPVRAGRLDRMFDLPAALPPPRKVTVGSGERSPAAFDVRTLNVRSRLLPSRISRGYVAPSLGQHWRFVHARLHDGFAVGVVPTSQPFSICPCREFF